MEDSPWLRQSDAWSPGYFRAIVPPGAPSRWLFRRAWDSVDAMLPAPAADADRAPGPPADIAAFAGEDSPDRV